MRVVAGLFQSSDGLNRVLVQQRHFSVPFPFFWEFPGGKVERGESDAAALQRECHEELAIAITVGQQIIYQASITHEQTGKVGQLVIYLVLPHGEPRCCSSQAFALRWHACSDLFNLTFCPADRPLVSQLAAGRRFKW